MSQWSGTSARASLRVSQGGKASYEASPYESRGIKGSYGMVELVRGLHHMNLGGDQGKFLSGGASA